MQYDVSQFSDDQLLALTDNEVELCIQTEYMRAGIVAVTRPEPPTYLEVPPPDSEVFQIEGLEACFVNQVDALQTIKQLSAYPMVKKDWKWKHDGVNVAEPRDNKYQIQSHAVYSPAVFDQCKEALAANEQKRKAFDQHQQEYKKFIDSSVDARNEVYDRINEARDRKVELERMSATWVRYKELSNGDEAIAANFWNKAYPDAHEEDRAKVGVPEAPAPVANSEGGEG